MLKNSSSVVLAASRSHAPAWERMFERSSVRRLILQEEMDAGAPYGAFPRRSAVTTLTHPLLCLQRDKGPAGVIDTKSDSKTDEKEKEEKFLRCAACKAPITRECDRISINEQHQHVFTNPHGYIFQIGCFVAAQGCVFSDDETNFFSWFPGYAWRYALCGQCLTHLGWGFRSQDSQFVGLILDRLLIE